MTVETGVPEVVAGCTIVPAGWFAPNVIDTQPCPEPGSVLVVALIPDEIRVPPPMVSAPLESRPPSPPRVAEPVIGAEQP